MIRLLLSVWMLLIGSIALAAEPGDTMTTLLRERFEQQAAASFNPARINSLQLEPAVALFYAHRNFAPAWLDERNTGALLAELAELGLDGLDPADYQLTELLALRARVIRTPADASLRTAFDVMTTAAYLRAVTHLFRGKVNPRTLSADWNFTRNDMDTEKAMQLVTEAVDQGRIARAFDFARPQHALYGRMRAGLAQLREQQKLGDWPQIESTTTLKPGMTDAQVAVLRRRLQMIGYTSGDTATPELFDDALADAVRRFQHDYYLDVDGEVGRGTRAALNVPVSARIDQLRVNLERGRWMLQALNGTFVLVDVAGYKVSFFRDATPIWQASVQVGKPYRATPIFRSEVTHVTFNPTWTIPPTILRKDVLPKLRKNLDYLTENNVRVYDRSGRQLDPAAIDWSNPGPVTLRQDAGPDGALGQVAIRFPNRHAVYLHDTPHQKLFGKGQRAFSSGCIRVERPLELVELLFNDPGHWSRPQIEAAIATGKTHNVNLPQPVPILLMYWTVDVRADGGITFKPDIYRNDPAVLHALNKRSAG
jgi:murein L,D-transpeptidase YcbB/YkuD